MSLYVPDRGLEVQYNRANIAKITFPLALTLPNNISTPVNIVSSEFESDARGEKNVSLARSNPSS